MADTIKIRNKKTGEIVTLRRKQKREAPQEVSKGERITEELIRGREGQGITQPIQDYFKKDTPFWRQLVGPSPVLGPALETASEGINRAHAAVANPIIGAIQGQVKNPAEAAFAAWRGVTGQRYGKLGDIPRQGLYGKIDPIAVEAISGTTDVIGDTMATLGLGRIAKMRPKLMTDKWAKEQGRTLVQGIDKALEGFRGRYSAVFNSPTKGGQIVDDVAVATDDVAKSLTDLPKALKKRLLKFVKDGENKVKDIRKLREAIDDEIGDFAYGNVAQGKTVSYTKKDLMKAKSQLKSVILGKVDPATKNKIIKLDKPFGELANKGKKIKRMLIDRQTKDIKPDTILGAYTNPKAVGTRETVKDLRKFNGLIKQAEKNFKRYGFRQKVKRVAPWAIGATFGGRLLYDAVENLKGE